MNRSTPDIDLTISDEDSPPPAYSSLPRRVTPPRRPTPSPRPSVPARNVPTPPLLPADPAQSPASPTAFRSSFVSSGATTSAKGGRGKRKPSVEGSSAEGPESASLEDEKGVKGEEGLPPGRGGKVVRSGSGTGGRVERGARARRKEGAYRDDPKMPMAMFLEKNSQPAWYGNAHSSPAASTSSSSPKRAKRSPLTSSAKHLHTPVSSSSPPRAPFAKSPSPLQRTAAAASPSSFFSKLSAPLLDPSELLLSGPARRSSPISFSAEKKPLFNPAPLGEDTNEFALPNAAEVTSLEDEAALSNFIFTSSPSTPTRAITPSHPSFTVETFARHSSAANSSSSPLRLLEPAPRPSSSPSASPARIADRLAGRELEGGEEGVEDGKDELEGDDGVDEDSLRAVRAIQASRSEAEAVGVLRAFAVNTGRRMVKAVLGG